MQKYKQPQLWKNFDSYRSPRAQSFTF